MWPGNLYGLSQNAKAELFFKRSRLINELNIFVQQLGPDHPVVATVLSKLAGLYSLGADTPKQGRSMSKISIYEKAWANHKDVAMVLNKLAELYGSQGRYDKAEPLWPGALNL